MFGNKDREKDKEKFTNSFSMLTTVRSAVIYYYNEEHEKTIVSIWSLNNLTDKLVKSQVEKLTEDLGQPEDTKMYVAIEGNEYRVH